MTSYRPVVAGATLALALTACGGTSADPGPLPTDVVDPGGQAWIIVQQPEAPALAAPLEGAVSIENDCVLIINRFGGVLQRAAWPFGTTFDPDTDVLTLPNGGELSDGGQIEGGGGGEGPAMLDNAFTADNFIVDTITEFTRTCRSEDVEIDEIFVIASQGLTAS